MVEHKPSPIAVELPNLFDLYDIVGQREIELFDVSDEPFLNLLLNRIIRPTHEWDFSTWEFKKSLSLELSWLHLRRQSYLRHEGRLSATHPSVQDFLHQVGPTG